MYLKEKQIKVSTDIFDVIEKSENGISDIRKFIYDYKNLRKQLSSFEISELVKKAINKKKVSKKIQPFYSDNKKFIKMLVENDLFYRLTSGLFIEDDCLDLFLDEIQNTDKKILDKFLEQMETLNLKEFVFTESKMNIQSYIAIRKTIFSDKEEFSTILTDGKVFMMGRFYNETFPYLLRNPKYVFEIHSKDSILNQLYINTFDVALPRYEELEEAKNVLPNPNTQELKNRTSYIRYLFELEKMEYNLFLNKANIYDCKKLLLESSEVLDETIKMIESQLVEVKDKINKAEELSIEYGFNDEFLEINMEYMRSCQRSLENDID